MMRRAFPIGLLLVATTQAAWSQQPRTHDLALTPEHVHWGYYDSRVPPAIRVASGDRVRVETMVAGGLQRVRLAGINESEIPEALKTVELRVTERGPGAHPLTGPIWIEGAEPGDTLEVRILAIEFLHPFGVVAFNPVGGVIPDDFPYAHFRLLRWQPGADHVDFGTGVSLKLAPFFGSIGVAPPPLVGRISSRPPGWHGGNLDNKDLVAGTTLYLPVHVRGALLSIGDGHALQADRRGHRYCARDVAPRHVRAARAEGAAAALATRGDADPLHRHGTPRGSR
jgi:acetamidase/formamidase